MKKQRITLCILTVLLFVCCGKKKVEIPGSVLTVDKEIIELNDSTFFKSVKSLVFNDGKLYGVEEHRSQILVLDEDLRFLNTIGNLGRGPKELLYAGHMTVYKDTVTIVDGGNDRIQLYHSNGEYIDSEKSLYETCFWPFFRFVYKNHTYAGEARNNPDSAFVIGNNHAGAVKYFGKRFQFASSFQNRIRNHRYLLDGGNYLIAASDNMPVIEKYDYQTGALLASFDLSGIEPVKSEMEKSAKKELADNSYEFYLVDCNIFKDKVYLLCNSGIDGYFVKYIMVFDCRDKFELYSQYILPEKIYTSIAINDHYLYAFSSDKCKLQRFKL